MLEWRLLSGTDGRERKTGLEGSDEGLDIGR